MALQGRALSKAAHNDTRMQLHPSALHAVVPARTRVLMTKLSGQTRPGAAPASQVANVKPVGRTHVVTAAQTSTSSGAIVSSDYLRGRGPYSTSQLPSLSFGVGQGSTGPLDCTVSVFVPRDPDSSQQRRWPLLVMSAGFLLHSGLYGSYGTDLASWGLTVVLYDLPEITDDVTMVNALTSIIDLATRDPRVSPHVDARAVLLAGHSRGGKLSVLAAAGDPRVKGVALLDPVDITGMTPMGPNYPSALPAMRVACGPPRRMPVLVLGAALNGDVIPADGNYKRFISSCPGPIWSLELQGAGHLQFLDMQVGLFSMLSKGGPTPDEAVRCVSKAALAAWALELAAPLARGEEVDGQKAVERLQRHSAAFEAQAKLSYSIQGFEHLGGYGIAGGAGAGSYNTSGGGGSSSSSRGSSPGGGYGSSANCKTGNGSASSSASSSSSSSSWSASKASWSAGGASNSASSSSSSPRDQPSPGTSGSARPRPPPPPPRTTPSLYKYDDLLRMRARELKTILVEAGVECSDCFEKEDLARRILERC